MLPIIKKVDPQLNEELLRDYTGELTGFVQVGKEKWFQAIKYEKIGHEFLNFEVRPDDTWIVTFPRSGTTVISELIWLLENNMDFDTAMKIPAPVRFPYIDMDLLFNDDFIKVIRHENELEGQKLPDLVDAPFWKTLPTAPSPRLIKSHLPLQLLPKNLLTCGAKIIYVARNPKDVAVSQYHLNRMARVIGYAGDFTRFWELFKNNLTVYAPYWDHVIGGWNNRNNPNVHFVFYEDLHRDSTDVVVKMAKFLNREITEEQVAKLVNHLKFENFKKNKSVSHDILADAKFFKVTAEDTFIRKGKVGGWVDRFTPEMSAEADKWIEENLKETDLTFSLF